VSAPGHRAGQVLAELVKQCRRIRAVLRHYAVPASMLDDLEQDVLLTAYRRIEEGAFRPPDPSKPLADNVAAWIRGIAKWIAIEANRARARHNRLFSSGPTKEHPIEMDATRVPSPAERFDAKEALTALDRLKMSPAQRETVALAAQGYTAREIAEFLEALGRFRVSPYQMDADEIVAEATRG
jgi:DNA-directed RNA polymerase specialized sigma24 family protein